MSLQLKAAVTTGMAALALAGIGLYARHIRPDERVARIGLSLRTGASWSERVAGLLQSHGPFTLAYLEALLRAADIRASRSSATEPPATEVQPATSNPDAR
jgi:hypothetical protein